MKQTPLRTTEDTASGRTCNAMLSSQPGKMRASRAAECRRPSVWMLKRLFNMLGAWPYNSWRNLIPWTARTISSGRPSTKHTKFGKKWYAKIWRECISVVFNSMSMEITVTGSDSIYRRRSVEYEDVPKYTKIWSNLTILNVRQAHKARYLYDEGRLRPSDFWISRWHLRGVSSNIGGEVASSMGA